MDSARDAVGVSGMVLIPTRFVWPYGGRNVFLSCSFRRWSELVPMTPIEGCPNVFQTIYSLAPGYHLYKFLVDGGWRHDELQPHISSEYGIVNTVLLSAEPNYIPAVSNPEISLGSNMDVEDSDAPHSHVETTDCTLIQSLPMIAEADLQRTRHRISVFLSSHSAYDLLPESSKVVALDIDLPVKQAFHILHEQGISLAPLWDFSKGQFVGVLSAVDFILILRELGKHSSNLSKEELETHSVSAWKEGKAYLSGRIDEHGRLLSRHFIHAKPYDNLKDVALKILNNEVAIVPIIHSSSEDGSFPQLLHLASLSGILKCICRYFRNCSSSLPILQLPIYALPIGTWVPKIGEQKKSRPLAMLRPNASLSLALNLLIQAQVSSLPIVDDTDALLDIYCRSDITALAKDRAYMHTNLDEITINQALQLGQDSYSACEPRSHRCHMCLRSDSLHKVMERLAGPGVRRLVIVEAGSKRVEGIVSLSDIFKFLLG